MTPPRLHLGDRGRDERSLSAYLLMAHVKVPFERVVHPPGTPGIPALEVAGERVVGLEAIADRAAALPAARSPWPPDAAGARVALARIADELAPLREAYGYALAPPLAPAAPTRASARALAAMESMVNGSPHAPFLFGELSVVDAALAPLAVRVRAYELAVGPRVRAWVDAVLALPALERFVRAAAEP